MRLANLTLILLLTSCTQPPTPDLCSIVNFDTAQCTPTDDRKEEYDLGVDKMLGYTCMSPDDVGDLKKYIKYLLRKVERQ